LRRRNYEEEKDGLPRRVLLTIKTMPPHPYPLPPGERVK